MKLIHLNILSLLFAQVVFAETTKVDIKEWLVPYEDSRPRDPYVALMAGSGSAGSLALISRCLILFQVSLINMTWKIRYDRII